MFLSQNLTESHRLGVHKTKLSKKKLSNIASPILTGNVPVSSLALSSALPLNIGQLRNLPAKIYLKLQSNNYEQLKYVWNVYHEQDFQTQRYKKPNVFHPTQNYKLN